ncbi:Periplasmic copper-binding protein (NosD) [uncultured archaeon]|nr:Periplasmic copper-binding protein (NosD) [uncultured archaeon]
MLRNKTYNRYYFRTVVEIMILAILLLLNIGTVGAQKGASDTLQQIQLQDALQMPGRLEANEANSVFIQPETDKVSKTSEIAIAANPLPGTIFIRDDATGGNCTLIGTWDNSTKTCTLTTNIAGTIQIDNDGITLNGNEHKITGNGTDCGVYLYYRIHVTIKNLIVEKFVSGICLSQSSYNNLTGNIILNNKDGIRLAGSDYNNITNNTALNNSNGIGLYFPPGKENNLTENIVKNNILGICICRGHDNNFTSNIVSNNSDGFRIYYSGDNTLKNNTISYNSGSGIFSDWGSINNKFTRNTISNNPGSGLILRYGTNNSFAENTVSNNSVGIIIAENPYKIFNNYFNNSNNTQIFFNISGIWNITKQPGTNIIGGPYLGGNFWAYPNGTGFSQTCTDNNKDGLCDIRYTLDDNNTDYLPLAAKAATRNLILNPGFESGTSPWIFYTDGTGKFTAGSPGYEGSKSANIVVYTGGTNIQLYQKGISLEPKTRYRLSFAAYSRTGHDLKVLLIKHVSPFTHYGLDQKFNLSASWQEFSTEFTTTGFTGSINNGRLMFYLAPFAKAGDKYYIDNVRLEKI